MTEYRPCGGVIRRAELTSYSIVSGSGVVDAEPRSSTKFRPRRAEASTRFPAAIAERILLELTGVSPQSTGATISVGMPSAGVHGADFLGIGVKSESAAKIAADGQITQFSPVSQKIDEFLPR